MWWVFGRASKRNTQESLYWQRGGPFQVVLYHWKMLTNKKDLTVRFWSCWVILIKKITASQWHETRKRQNLLLAVARKWTKTSRKWKKRTGARYPKDLPAVTSFCQPGPTSYTPQTLMLSKPQWGGGALSSAGFIEPKFLPWGSKLCWLANPQRLAQVSF